MSKVHKPRGEAVFYESGDRSGYVLWCQCGVGTPLKATRAEAKESLAAHIEEPSTFPK